MEEIESDSVVAEALALAGFDNKLLALEVTYGGMGCGPMWFTDVFGFDYGTLASEVAES